MLCTFTKRGLSAAALALALSSAAPAADTQDDPVAKGQMLVTAGDCVSCHTAPGGKPFAGGLEMNTPFGTLSTPNITPDKETGLGNWSEADFYQALHEGIRKDGAYLYPVFPYPSFTKVREDDAKAIWAYLQSLEPVKAPRKPSNMQFPFNVRAGLLVWRQLYFNEGTYRPDPSWSPEVARGGYLVEGLGHCGTCHSPRTLLGGTETGDSLAGGYVDTFFAPDISSSLRSGIGGWSKQQVVEFLRKGADKGKGTVFGPMQEVVHNSLSKLPDTDIEAMAAYLLATPPRTDAPDQDPDLRRAAGGLVYVNNCSSCHQPDGSGIPNAIPNLAGNHAVAAESPDNVISAVLGGLPGEDSYGKMPSFADKLDDRQVADVVNYVRSSWGNFAPASATPDKVASIRSSLGVGGGAGEQAATAFECPAPGDLEIKPTTVNLMRYATADELGNRVGIIVAQVKRNHPGIGETELVDSVSAAYCPLLKAETGLSDAERSGRMASFVAKLQSQLTKEELPAGAKVLVKVPFAPETLSQVEAAAAKAKQTRDVWIEKAVEEGLKAGN